MSSSRPAPTACKLLASACAALALLAAAPSAQESNNWADAPGTSDLNSTAPASEAVPLAAPPMREPSPQEAKLLASTPALGGTEQSRGRLAAILARPEFQDGAVPAPQASWIERLLSRLAAWLAGLFRPLAGASVGVQILAAVCMLLLSGLLIYYLSRFIWMLAAARRGRCGEPASAGAEISRPEELLAAARKALANGDYRLALRLRFRALLAGLGLVAAPLMTNRELAEEICREVPAVAGALAELIRLFEDAWYGGVHCEVRHYERSDELANAVEERVRQARAEAAA